MKRVIMLAAVVAGVIVWRGDKLHVPAAATAVERRNCPGDIGCPGNPGSIRLVISQCALPQPGFLSGSRYPQTCPDQFLEQFRGASFEYIGAK